MNQYELLPGSDYTLQLVQPVSTPAKIFCKTEILQPQDYVRVQSGDVIGVSMPAQNALPLVASDATGYSLMMNSALNAPATLQSASLSEGTNMALHLYATVGKHNDTIINEIFPQSKVTVRMSVVTHHISISQSLFQLYLQPLPMRLNLVMVLSPQNSLHLHQQEARRVVQVHFQLVFQMNQRPWSWVTLL